MRTDLRRVFGRIHSTGAAIRQTRCPPGAHCKGGRKMTKESCKTYQKLPKTSAKHKKYPREMKNLSMTKSKGDDFYEKNVLGKNLRKTSKMSHFYGKGAQDELFCLGRETV